MIYVKYLKKFDLCQFTRLLTGNKLHRKAKMLDHHRLTSHNLLIVLKALSGGGESLLSFWEQNNINVN